MSTERLPTTKKASTYIHCLYHLRDSGIYLVPYIGLLLLVTGSPTTQAAICHETYTIRTSRVQEMGEQTSPKVSKQTSAFRQAAEWLAAYMRVCIFNII